MTHRYVISDLHFGHTGLLRIRPQFSSVEEMDDVVADWANKRHEK